MRALAILGYNLYVYRLLTDRYRIIELLGSGMAAEVYLARDELLDRHVAIKVLRAQYTDDKEFVERFRREAKSAAALSHPSIVSIYDRGETEDGTYYIVMEYVPGGTLKDHILREGPLSPHVAVEVAIQIAEALEAAHQKGVIHRDIKPQNILITESGDAKVADFGIARAASSTTLTQTGYVLGSVHYMSPEQAMGEPVGPQSDLYSLGVILYEMLTGELPFEAEDPMGVAMKHVNGPLRSPKEVNPKVPEGISKVTTRLLAKDPDDRYPSAAELIDELERAGEGRLLSSITTRALRWMAESWRSRPEKQTGRTKRYEGHPPPIPPKKEGLLSNFRKRIRRAVIRFVATAMLLLGLVLAGATAFDLWPDLLPALGLGGKSQNSQTYMVPDLRGRTVDEARSMTWPRFNLAVQRTENSARPQGTITRQDPSPNKRAPAGSTVSVVISTGSGGGYSGDVQEIVDDIQQTVEDIFDQMIERRLTGR